MVDSEGKYTKAVLPLTDFPENLTICGDYMVEAWFGHIVEADLFGIRTDTSKKASVKMTSTKSHIEFRFSHPFFYEVVHLDHVWFPLSWLHMCYSVESGSGNVVFVANGQVLADYPSYPAAKVPADWTGGGLEDNLRIELGHDKRGNIVLEEYDGMVSNINIFSSALSTERMVAITGGEECGAPGDYVSWEEADWQLDSKARLMWVEELENLFPCKKESKVTSYSAPFTTASSCMNHCQKIGGGRSPSIKTKEEWEWMFEQFHFITPNKMNYMWLAAQDSAEEEVWK